MAGFQDGKMVVCEDTNHGKNLVYGRDVAGGLLNSIPDDEK
jgi:hypothetical protein